LYCHPEQPTRMRLAAALAVGLARRSPVLAARGRGRLFASVVTMAPRPASATARQTTLARVKREAMTCKRCPLWKTGTQTVFGEGRIGAPVMLVGEEPGDREDLAGHPFVGPAGALLHEAMAEAGLADRDVYVTNAVKHFKWEPRGKRRIHKRPDQQEAAACLDWLEQEIALVRPRVIVALGATAASVLAPRGIRVMRDRGRLLESIRGGHLIVTVHPASILRVPDQNARRAARRAFVSDLKKVATVVARG
jgi:uracil-DNA glycosylase family protein